MVGEKKETKKEQQKSLHIEVVKQMVTLSTSGFGLVAALAWNNFVKELIDNYINKWLPKGSGLLSLFIYALAVTALAVLVTLQLSKLAKTLENEK